MLFIKVTQKNEKKSDVTMLSERTAKCIPRLSFKFDSKVNINNNMLYLFGNFLCVKIC